jgi:hypothetical protein
MKSQNSVASVTSCSNSENHTYETLRNKFVLLAIVIAGRSQSKGIHMKKLKEEFFKILPPTIYFFVALHLVMFVRVLMLEGTGLSPYSSASIAITALVLGKAVLIADMLPLINRFPDKPLIYNIAWKTVIYLLLSAVLHYLERLIDFWRETGSFVAGNEKLLSVIIWPHFFAIQILLFVLIAMYCTVHELVRVIGREKALRIFFGPMPAPEV